jgi:FixJ family two-component response regulator
LLQKPFERAELLDALHMALDKALQGRDRGAVAGVRAVDLTSSRDP